MIHPDDLSRAPRVLTQSLKRGRAAWNFRVRHADGRYRRWYEEVRPLPSRNGEGAKLISCLARMTGRVPTLRLRQRVRDRLDGYMQAVGSDVAVTPKFKRVELALRTSEERLSYALKGANDGLWDWYLPTDTVYYSPRWKEMLGYADHEVENHLSAWRRLVHPEDREAILRQAANFTAGLIPRYELEFRMRHKAGHWVDILARATLIRNAQGRPQRLVGTHVDITARCEAERQLRAMQAQLEQRVQDRTAELEVAHLRLATLLHTAPAGIVIHGADGRVLLTNAASQKILGPTADETGGKSLEDPAWQFLREDGTPMPLAEYPVAQVLATRRALMGQIQGVQNARLPELVWVYANAEPCFDDQGEIAEVVVSFMDITRRIEAERALRESEERLRLALVAANQGFYDLNVQTGECVVSPEYATMLGYDPAVFRESSAAWIERLHPDDREAVAQNYQEYVAGLRPVYAVEFRQRTHDGGWKWILSFGKIVSYTADGRPLRMLGTHTDITGRKRAETELRESEAKYRNLIECIWDAYATVDLHGNILQANSTLAAMVGYSEAELRQMAFWEFTPPQWHAAEEKILREQVLSRGYSDVYEKEYRHKNGSVLPVELRAYLVRDAAGEPFAMWGIIRDITARKRLETELRQLNESLEQRVTRRTESLRLSEQRFRTLAEATFEGVMLSRQGQILDCNEQLAAILACPRDQLVRRMWPDFVAAGMRDQVQQALLAGAETHLEYEVNRADGAWCIVETHGRSPDGPDGICITSVRDITGQRLAELALRDSEARFRQLAESTFEGIVVSESGRITDCNSQVAVLFGYQPAEVLGREIVDFVAPESRPLVAAQISSGADDPYEFLALRKDGAVFPAESHARMMTRDGRLLRITAIRDLTAIRQADAELERQRIQLAHAQRLAELSEVSAGVIHQIGQPFTAIINNVSAAKTMVARCTNQHCQASATLLDTDASLKLVQTTMNHLRSLAHPERVRREPRDLNVLVAEVIRLLRPEAEPLGIEMRLCLTPDLPPALMDDIQLSQAVLNLLRNACDAVLACGPPRRRVTVTTRRAEGDRLLIAVADLGLGIAPADLPRLFDPFFTTKPNGTGVGLRLCRTIVTAHGGTLVGRNTEPGPGATFEITLPISSQTAL